MKELSDNQFTHLKIHTQYSICEGALRTADLAKYCKDNKIKAVGLCDSNNLCGAIEFSESISKAKTQPIIGTQINFKYKEQMGKLPLFAKNLEGYKNLIKLSSKSFLEIEDNEDPHIKIEDLESNYKGLILISGSFESLIGKLFFKNLTDEVSILFKRFKDLLDDNFYVEIQRHNDHGENMLEKFLLDISSKLSLPIIATHEVFYLEKDMYEAHDAYLCVGEKTYVSAKDRKKYTDAHYLKNSEEMHKLFSDLPEAIENNKNFPLRISFRPKYSAPVLPNIKTKDSKSPEEILINESKIGLKKKLNEYVLPFKNETNTENIVEVYNNRLNHEITIISKMKY